MVDDAKKHSMQQIELWFGVLPPNMLSDELISGLGFLVDSFSNLRGDLAFEDEPVSFEAALAANRELNL